MVAVNQKRLDGLTSVGLQFTDGSTPQIHSHAENRAPENQDCLTHWLCLNMSRHTPTTPSKNALDTLASQQPVLAMDYSGLATDEKKTLGYKQRCPKQRAAYLKCLATAEASGKTLVYLDETGFRDEAFRRYGYAPRGQCVYGLIASQRTRTKTLIVAQLGNKLIAPKLLSGSCNAHRFNKWLDQELCPFLDTQCVVIMDNARIHKTVETQALIQASGASLLYLPPYSPDYNPVEHQFANIKRLRSYNPEMPIQEIINMFR